MFPPSRLHVHQRLILFNISRFEVKLDMAPLDPANIIDSRRRVLEDSNMLYLIFGHLDPASVKDAALVSKYVQLYRYDFD